MLAVKREIQGCVEFQDPTGHSDEYAIHHKAVLKRLKIKEREVILSTDYTNGTLPTINLISINTSVVKKYPHYVFHKNV